MHPLRPTVTGRLAGVTAILALSGTFWLAAASRPASAAGQQAQQDQPADQQSMTALRQNMMMMRQHMTADTEQAAAKLQSLVDQMNAATGDARIDAMAAVLTELVAQQQATRQGMGSMMMPMMRMMGMMQQMNTGMQHMMQGQGSGNAPTPGQ